jgi:hypothetical protein
MPEALPRDDVDVGRQGVADSSLSIMSLPLFFLFVAQENPAGVQKIGLAFFQEKLLTQKAVAQ